MNDSTFNGRQLVLVEYPAVVRSTDRMINSLGGIELVSRVYNDPSTALKIKFRPEDPYCKGARANLTYYFNEGPFRSVLVRLGFDPRKDPSTKIYQSLVFWLCEFGTFTPKLIDAKDDSESACSIKDGWCEAGCMRNGRNLMVTALCNLHGTAPPQDEWT
ncbi:uncharacterized protein LOC144175455 [Haemaphysalis longicornis]